MNEMSRGDVPSGEHVGATAFGSLRAEDEPWLADCFVPPEDFELLGGMQSVVEATLDRWFTDATAAARPDTVEKIRGQILACDPNGYAACAEAIGAMDLREDLAHINAPTLVVAGAEDPSQSLDAIESWARTIPGARLEVLPGAHLVNLAEPAAFGALIAEHLDRYGAPT